MRKTNASHPFFAILLDASTVPTEVNYLSVNRASMLFKNDVNVGPCPVRDLFSRHQARQNFALTTISTAAICRLKEVPMTIGRKIPLVFLLDFLLLASNSHAAEQATLKKIRAAVT